MAIATRKKPSGKTRARRTTAARPKRTPRRDPLDEVEAPDRAAPPLAEVDADALEFIAAIDRFKKEHGRPFPSWSEILLIVRQLGYRRG